MEENKIKNKIIAISGEPVTGKGTTVKSLIAKLQQNGYKEEDIHLMSTGKEFRRYFNIIFEFVKNVNNEEILKELSKKEELKTLFSNPSYRTSISRLFADIRNGNINISDTLTIEQANNMPELKPMRDIVDAEIDGTIARMGKEINKQSRPNEIWIFDSRLAFHNIPEAFSVRLTCDANIAGQRLFNDTTRGKEDRAYKTIEEAEQAREKRRIGENLRYKEGYGIDLEEQDNYDLIIDTSYASIDDISDTILSCLDYYMAGKPFGNTWTSPKKLLPTQDERCTLYELEYLINCIKSDGYYPDSVIPVTNIEGKKFIIDGHHRSFGAACGGKTLVPYSILKEGTEDLYFPRLANFAYGHESLIGKDFSYEDIYPGIYKELKKERSETERPDSIDTYWSPKKQDDPDDPDL